MIECLFLGGYSRTLIEVKPIQLKTCLLHIFMKSKSFLVIILSLSGCTNSGSLLESCNDLANDYTWTKAKEKIVSESPMNQGHAEIWLQNQNGNIARCLSCEDSNIRASSFETFKDGKTETIIVATCGPY